MGSMIILPEWLITSPLEGPKAQWGIRVTGDCIMDVAKNDILRHRYPSDEIWEAHGQVLAPGFVDAHTHLYGVLAHGIPLEKAPSGFWPFLEEFWWPLVEDRLDQALIGAATNYRCAQMIRSGVTSFYDCTEAPYALPGVLQEQAEIVEKWGLRALLSFEATERVSSENGRLGVEENLAMIQAGQRDQNAIVKGMMCFHTTFTCPESFIKEAFELAESHGVLTHMHVSEGNYEPEYCLREFGLRPMFYYDKLGVLGPGMLASQCVQVSKEEIDLMVKRGVRVSHMPLSNCEVGGGIAPVPEMLSAGLTLGLGSDGYITDFFEVMRGAFLIHKASHCDPQVMPADQVWYLATEGGAKALGFDQVGRLAEGWQADLQLIEPHLPTPLAEHNLYEQLLLYCHQCDVQGTMIAGKVLMRAGEVVQADWDGLFKDTHAAAELLWKL
jgi:5-methylthioadenosine/S-adenosylhomocysteine deaminase